MTDIVERFKAEMIALMEKADTEIEQLRVETTRLRAASEWRDISTAPRDGTSFIACIGEWMTICCWNKYRDDWCVVAPGYPSYDPDERPTHWQPLPTPPQRNEVKK